MAQKFFDALCYTAVFFALVLAAVTLGIIVYGFGTILLCAITGVSDMCSTSLLGNV